MTTQQSRSAKAAPMKLVTTNTGRILRVDPNQVTGQGVPTVPATRGEAAAMDPARRTDVLFRVRRAEGHELSSWWMIGAFVVSTGLVIALLSWVPGGA